VANIIYALSPQRIILGGGIMKQAKLFPLIRRNVLSVLNGYLEVPAITERINEYIVPPALGDKAGVFGAIALARFQ
jgi:fructokinase